MDVFCKTTVCAALTLAAVGGMCLDAKIRAVESSVSETDRLCHLELGRARSAVDALVAARSNDVEAINRELGNVYRSLDAILYVSTNRMPKVVAGSVSSAVNKRLTDTEDKMLTDHEARLVRLEQEVKRCRRR